MKRLQSKITLTYIVLIVLVTVGVGILSGLEVEDYLISRLVDEMTRQIDMVAAVLQKMEQFPQPQSLTEQVAHLSQIVHSRITLIDTAGKVAADSDVKAEDLPNVENHLLRPEVQSALRYGIGTDSRRSRTVGVDFMYVAKVVQPLAAQGPLNTLKFIRVAMPLTAVQKTTREIRFKITLVSLLLILLVAIVSVQISRRVAKPITRIAEAVRDIQAGNLERRIAVTSNDEIGQLASVLNQMLDKLEADIVQLRKLERMRSEFLGNVSHELRTPIFSIQGFIETLLDGALEDPQVNRAFLEKAHAQVARLNTLLNDLIEISRIESGEMKMSFRYFRLREFLQQIVAELQPDAEKKHIALTLTAPDNNEVKVLGDKERLKQVLINLIDNAIKYTNPGGSVRLSYVEEANIARIVISDTGIGIAEEHLPRIFERFYRVDTDRSRAGGGTGLG
jgi:two-component system phosphate regulon sensor histidine kinase PhoR